VILLKEGAEQPMKTRMRHLLARLCLLAGTVGLALLVPAVGEAASKGPCVAGTKRPLCHWSRGKVTFVADGDTIAVDVFGDGTSKPIRVRLTGINAMEHYTYSRDPRRRRGECHALEATARLERVIKGGRRIVRLSSQARDPKAGRRHRRAVAVRVAGRWRDVGQILIDEGHVLWLPNRGEWAHNSRYNLGAQKAAAAGLRLWDTDYCGSGPNQPAQLRMWVNWDADGPDGRNRNGEWVKIKNVGATDLPIGHWWFRDSWVKRFSFPSGSVIPAGGAVTLFVGNRPSSDTNRTTHFYWGRRGSIYEDVRGHGVGDGGYLFDPQGDLRAWMTYPCTYACADPLRGSVELRAHPSGTESVDIENTSSQQIDLEGYLVDNGAYNYAFGANTVLDPGETLQLMVIGSRSTDTRLVKHWGKSGLIFVDGGGRIVLRTQTNIRIDCDAWGSMSC
jgi:endonuclease YncB( thermonuclease family)